MRAHVDTAGERLSIDCELSWVAELLEEATAGALRRGPASSASVSVRVEANRRPFATRGWELLTRGTWCRGGEVVMENACTAGFDLHLSGTGEIPAFTFRRRPPAREKAATWALRSRFHLLARAVLVQYPALWAAGIRGRVPLHASAVTVGAATPMLVANSGIGRSTLLMRELETSGRTTGDNVAVGDGRTLWGLVEPVRMDGAHGRRMPHGRRETPLPARATALVPDCVVVLTRGRSTRAAVAACEPGAATGALVAGVYMAGELRRYWSFAATLSAGTGLGSRHPSIAKVATAFASRLPCLALDVGASPRPRLAELLGNVEVAA
jgi:hypothetical protein